MTDTTPALAAVSDLETTLAQAAIPMPEYTTPPQPVVPARYVAVWPHVLEEIEKFPNATAVVLANGTLIISPLDEYGFPAANLPTIKGYAPGAWATFEHVGDYTPTPPPVKLPRGQRRYNEEPPTRRRAAPPADTETDQPADQPRMYPELSDTPPRRDYRLNSEDKAAPAPRVRRPAPPSEKVDADARDRAQAVVDAVRPQVVEDGDDGAPKASGAVTSAHTEPPVDPEFWDDDQPARKASLWLRFWRSLTDGPRPDPSLESEDR